MARQAMAMFLLESGYFEVELVGGPSSLPQH